MNTTGAVVNRVPAPTSANLGLVVVVGSIMGSRILVLLDRIVDMLAGSVGAQVRLAAASGSHTL